MALPRSVVLFVSFSGHLTCLDTNQTHDHLDMFMLKRLWSELGLIDLALTCQHPLQCPGPQQVPQGRSRPNRHAACRLLWPPDRPAYQA